MSTYVQIYARKGDTFIELSNYSRNSEIYSLFETHAPYEKIRPLTEQDIKDIVAECNKAIVATIDEQDRLSAEMRAIDGWKNPVGEKLGVYRDIGEQMYDARELQKQYEATLAELDMFSRIACTYKGCGHPVIYCGVESGLDVTTEDIEKGE